MSARSGIKILAILILVVSCNQAKQESEHVKLWYQQPADARMVDNPNGWRDDPEWLKALPLGNGSLGAMVFGDVNFERIQLNEESMWSGSPDDNDNPDAYEAQDKIRQLLFDGKYKEATALTNSTQICKGSGSGHGNGANVPFGCFQTLGDLWIDFRSDQPFTDYHRELDLNEGIVRVDYQQEGVHYSREIFSSYPDQVLVARFTADKKGALSFKCTMTRPERFSTSSEADQLIMQGALHDGKGGEGLKYMVRLKALQMGGDLLYQNDSLTVQNADEVTLLLSASTSYVMEYPDYQGRDFTTLTERNLYRASQKNYSELLETHIEDHQALFDRVNLELTPGIKDTIPTDQRISMFRSTLDDRRLVELMFQYGRYLLIASSRPGTLPANLQGIWANKIQTPWNGDYHTDVNIEMNYWPAEVTNLSELHLPMFDLITSLVKPGTKTANIHYHSDGWVVHPITNVWGYTSPGESASWGMHTGAGAWICQHIGEHYAFTGDLEFLKKMYPVLEGSARFYMDWLVEDPATGNLVSGPAVSPENTFIAPDGSRSQISMGPAHDQQVIWQLFSDFLYASRELGIESALVGRVSQAKEQLAGPRIGSDGRLMEWAEEFPEVEPGHRHISHMFALHPGSQISIENTPELAQAAKRSLDYRIEHGGGHTGWSAAWLISQYARLQEAEQAKKSLDVVLSKSASPNLFGQHPPFQMDANFGATTGIAEMLLQSHTGIIHLLPALPEAWPNGTVNGLCARGNLSVDIRWENHQLAEAVLIAGKDGTVDVKYGKHYLPVAVTKGERIAVGFDGEKLVLETGK